MLQQRLMKSQHRTRETPRITLYSRSIVASKCRQALSRGYRAGCALRDSVGKESDPRFPITLSTHAG